MKVNSKEADHQFTVSKAEGSNLDLSEEKVQLNNALQQHALYEARHNYYGLLYVILVPLYTLLGGVAFHQVEGQHDRALVNKQDICLEDVWRLNDRYMDGMNEAARRNDTQSVLHLRVQQVANMQRLINDTDCIGAPKLPLDNFMTAVLYAFTIYTTIGYGDPVAKTKTGIILTVIYAIIGVPIYFAAVADATRTFVIYFGRLNRRLLRKYSSKSTVKDTKQTPIHQSTSTPMKLKVTPVTTTRDPSLTMSHTQPSTQSYTHSEHTDTTHNKIKALTPNRNATRNQCSPSPESRSRHPIKMMTHAGPVMRAWNQSHTIKQSGRIWKQSLIQLSASMIIWIVFTLLSGWFIVHFEDLDYAHSLYMYFQSTAVIGFGDPVPRNHYWPVMSVHILLMFFGSVAHSIFYYCVAEQIQFCGVYLRGVYKRLQQKIGKSRNKQQQGSQRQESD